jgi:Phage Mu protein F like protein
VTTLAEALTRFLEATTPLRRDELLAPHVDTASAKLARGFAKQGAVLLAELPSRAIREAIAEPPADPSIIDAGLGIFDEASVLTARLLADPLDVLTSAALDLGAGEMIADLSMDLSFDLANPRAVQYLQRRGAELVTKIDQTTREQLRDLLVDGVSQGQGYGTIATRIRDLFSGFSTERGTLIATYEAGSAYSEGNLIVGQDLQDGGLEMEKSWLAEMDDRTSDECAANADQGWIPLDEAFQSGDDRPLAHPNCRCALLIRRVGSDS